MIPLDQWELGVSGEVENPSLYFWKSAKWVRHITVLAADAPDYWKARGYHAVGDPWAEQRYG